MTVWRQRGFVLNPFRFGTAPASVAFVAASSTIYAEATSQNQTIPAAVEGGDRLLAVVMHRSALTVVPNGWVLVDSQSCTNTSSTQYTSIYKRLAESGDAAASTTWGQASSGRICVHIVAFRKPGGCDVVAAATGAQNNVVTAQMNWANLTSGADGAMGVAASSLIAATASGSTSISASNGTLTTVATVAQNRLGVAYRARSNGQTLSGTFTSSVTPSNNGAASVSVLIA